MLYEKRCQRAAAKENQGQYYLPLRYKNRMLANQAVKAIEGDAINELPDYLMLPDKIASIVVALLSDSMQYITGVAIDVDEAKTWED